MKSRKLIPSRGFKFNTRRPMIMKAMLPLGKLDGTHANLEGRLGTPPWLSRSTPQWRYTQ